MKILDDTGTISRIDTLGMLDVEEGFYSQLKNAISISRSARINNIKTAPDSFKGIAILGMGGSGFAGDLVKSLVEDFINIPVEIVKSYRLPGFVSDGWLAVAASYSGNTEETISASMQALSRGCEFAAISAGGIIEDIAGKNKKDHIKIPSGLQPRGASGYLFFSTYMLLDSLGIIKVDSNDIDETLSLIEKKAALFKREVSAGSNSAKQLAISLFGRIPVIYGVSGYLSSIAYRWKCMINENSKCPCFCAEFPELNHNETVGWENLKELTNKMVLVVFKDEEFEEKIKTRIDTTVNLIRENFDDIVEVPVEGRSALAKAISAMYLGDIASVYLAFLYNTDPTPVKRIDALKAELAKLN